MEYNISTWPFFFTPWDLLIGCSEFNVSRQYTSKLLCDVSNIAGVLCAYLLPIITLLNILANIITCVIFLYGFKHKTRQMVYLGCFSIADIFYCFILSILYYIPSRGIPYASNAAFYFFIDYQSTFSCIAYKYLFSLACSFRGNMLVLTMLDKFLSIEIPIRYGKLPTRYAWYFIFSTFIITHAMILPATVQFTKVFFGGKMACWLKTLTLGWSLYYGLISDFCLIQTTTNGILSLMLLIKVYLWLRRRRKMTHDKSDENSKELSACIILLSVSSLNVLSSIPGEVAYFLRAFVAFADDPDVALLGLRTALALRDIFWCLMPLQGIFNTIVYMTRLRKYRESFISIFTCKKLNTFMSDISD
ncbi:unnamed protein product [Heterobilharzia americana]|nr:unnamed protein product [Heterobilharzia americana]